VITHGPGIGAVTWIAALVTVSGLVVALVSVRLDRAERYVSPGRSACAIRHA
jgi:DHA1 family inner membrane transport protein